MGQDEAVGEKGGAVEDQLPGCIGEGENVLCVCTMRVEQVRHCRSISDGVAECDRSTMPERRVEQRRYVMFTGLVGWVV